MEEAHKAVLKRKRVHDDEIIPVPDEIRDYNNSRVLPFVGVEFSFGFNVEGSSFCQIGSSICWFIQYRGAKGLPCSQCHSLVQVQDQGSGSLARQRRTQIG